MVLKDSDVDGDVPFHIPCGDIGTIVKETGRMEVGFTFHSEDPIDAVSAAYSQFRS